MKRFAFTILLLPLLSLAACSEDDAMPDPIRGAAYDLSLALCSAAERCNPSVEPVRCGELLDGRLGAPVWPMFGLPEGSWTTSSVDADIDVGDIHLNVQADEECRRSFLEVCDSEGERIDSLTYDSVGNLVPTEGPCAEVFDQVGP